MKKITRKLLSILLDPLMIIPATEIIFKGCILKQDEKQIENNLTLLSKAIIEMECKLCK